MATVNARLGSSVALAGALIALWLGSASSAAGPAQPTATANPDPWAHAAVSAGASATAQPAEPSAAAETANPAPAPAAQPADAPAPAASAPSAPAKRLVAVQHDGSESGTVIHLQADGSLAGFKTFTLRDPARLVIDLPGIQNGLAKNTTSVGTPQVSRVRVADHDGKLRVVIDGGPNAGNLEKAQVLSTADGLVVAMGEGEGVQKAIAAAQAGQPAQSAAAAQAPAEKAKHKGGAQVQQVEFTPGSDADHLVVSSDRAVEFHILKPDADTLMIMVPGAHLASDAKTRIEPEAGGPVALVSAFEQPDLKKPEVRVVVKRASGLEPSVHREGNSITLAFERGKGVAALPVNEPAAAAAMPAAPASDASNQKLAKAEKGAAAMAPPAAPAKGKSKGMGPEGEEPVQMLEEGGLLDGKEYVGRRISLDFKDVDIRDVLRLIADVSDLNIIAGDEVSGNVTIRLVDVPWDQALDVILLTKGLGFIRVGNVLRIAPADTLKQEEEARLQERRAKEKLEDLSVKLQPVNYAKVDQVASLVKRLLTPRGSVDVDKRTNTLVIKDISSVIDEATALVKAIDSQTPQVMIESRIVEANLDFSKQIGVEWGGGTQPDSDMKDFTIGGIKPVTSPGGTGSTSPNFPFNGANNVVVTNPMTMTPGGVLNLGSFLLNDKVNLAVRLAAAELNGEGKVISSPRVVTLDNAEAMIEQGVSIPFQTFQNGDAQLEFVDAVLSLKVKPHITADKSIIMEIEVTRNAPDNSVDTPTGSPAIQKNQAKTETLVKDGQTLVLGGIYVVETTENSQRVPGLWKIPVLGAAFRNWGDTDKRRELLIFVTPSIVVSPEAAS